jgi:hypothetical protein
VKRIQLNLKKINTMLLAGAWILRSFCNFLFQTPCVFHARPALLRFAIHRARPELTLGQARTRSFVQAPKA